MNSTLSRALEISYVSKSIFVAAISCFALVPYGFSDDRLPPFFRMGKDNVMGLVDAEGRIAVSPQYEGVARGWQGGFLWTVRHIADKNSGNFLGSHAKEVLEKPVRQFIDEDMFIAPSYFAGRARVRLQDGQCAFVTETGVLGHGHSWDSELIFLKTESELRFVDRDGQEVLRLIGQDAIANRGGLLAVKQGKAWGLFNVEGECVLPAKYDEIRAISDADVWFVVESGKCGIFSGSGDWMVRPQYEGVTMWPGQSVAAFLRDGKWGLLRTDTEEIIKSPEYDELGPFGKKLAWGRRSALWHPIATDGIHVLSTGFDRVNRIYQTPEIWEVQSEGRSGIVNGEGEVILPCIYRSIQKTADGYVVVRNGDGSGLFYTSGKHFALAPQYDRIIYWSELSGQVAMVKSERKWGMARLGDEELLLPIEHDLLRKWNKLIETRKGDRIALFDNEGNAVLPWNTGTTELPDTYSGFANGFGKIVCRGKVGLLDEDGKIALACRYQDVGRFSEGRVPAKKDGQWGYVNLDGEWIIQPQYSNAHAFLNGLAAVQRNGKYGYINARGQSKIPFRYADAGYAYNDRMPVAREDDGKTLWGLIDTSGETVLPIEYECVEWVDLGPEPTQFHGQVTWKVY